MPEKERMIRTLNRPLLYLAAALLIPACGGSSGGGYPMALMRGGVAVSNTTDVDTSGGWGGQVNVYSRGLIHVASGSAPDAPELPTAPAGGTEIQSADLLGSEYTLNLGHLLIKGDVQAPGGSDYIIYALQGDIVIDGTLRAGDPGPGNPRNLSVRALNGTIFVRGTLSASNTDGVNDGNDAGNLTLMAKRIVVTGRIEAVGEKDTGADGGNLGLDTQVAENTPDLVLIGADIDLSGSAGTPGYPPGKGGTATFTAGQQFVFQQSTLKSNGGGGNWNMTPDIKGGHAGWMNVDAPLSVVIDGRIELKGGSVTTQPGGAWGGDAGRLNINRAGDSGPVHLFAALDFTGGEGRTNGGGNIGVSGGSGGYIEIGEVNNGAPTAVYLGFGFDVDGGSGDGAGEGGEGGDISLRNHSDDWGDLRFELPVFSSGGKGGNLGGAGGDLDLYLSSGEISVTASIVMNGGDSEGRGTSPVGGDGGYALFNANDTEGLWGRVHVGASITVNGGSAVAGTADGGPGGTIQLGGFPNTIDGLGDIVVDAVDFIMDGGRGFGAGNAGIGGEFTVSVEGTVDFGARVYARGGSAPGGNGGRGGYFRVDSDRGNSGVGGDVTLRSGFYFDGSGGTGLAGGNGFNDNAPGLNPLQLAFKIKAGDGNVTLAGTVVSRGGAADGSGGDAGVYTTGTVSGAPSVDLNGAGAGADGEDNF